MTATSELGPVVRLWGLKMAELPPLRAAPDDLVPFLLSILQEAVPFIDSAAPKREPRTGPAEDEEEEAAAAAAAAKKKEGQRHRHWRQLATQSMWRHKGRKTGLAGCTAPVELLERTITAQELERLASLRRPISRGSSTGLGVKAGVGRGKSAIQLPPETWACRRSVHEDKAQAGTASWAEFRECIKDHHAETEEAFTPSMVAHRRAMRWDCRGLEVELEEEGGTRTKWGDFTLQVEEVRHSIGRPLLKDRVFAAVQLTCTAQPAEERREFLVVNIPAVDLGLTAVDGAGSRVDDSLSAEQGVVLGAYASVERVRKMDGGADGPVEWLMATASDARGALPLWVQARAVPGQIAKDVPLFLGWLEKQRQSAIGAGSAR